MMTPDEAHKFFQQRVYATTKKPVFVVPFMAALHAATQNNVVTNASATLLAAYACGREALEDLSWQTLADETVIRGNAGSLWAVFLRKKHEEEIDKEE